MIDFETSGAGKLESSEPKAESKLDNRVALYVKISPQARDILDGVAIAPRTRATVIEKLLESFARESVPIRDQILEGKSPNTLREHGELLELRSWAEHAFQNERYVWAAGMYGLLAEHPSASDGLKNICNYRLSLCFIRLSYDVREEALARGVDQDSYNLAIDTLNRAIDYTRKVRRKLANNLLLPELVLYYNLASCCSLKAQYLAEMTLDPNSEQFERLQIAGKKVEEKEKVWKSIGETWRKSEKADEELIKKVDKEVLGALTALYEIFPKTEDGMEQLECDDLDLPFERVWLVDSTLKDEDFIFLRLDKQTRQGDFEKWSERALHGRKPISDAVYAFLQK